MKQSKLLLGLIGICLLFGFSSCEEKIRVYSVMILKSLN